MSQPVHPKPVTDGDNIEGSIMDTKVCVAPGCRQSVTTHAVAVSDGRIMSEYDCCDNHIHHGVTASGSDLIRSRPQPFTNSSQPTVEVALLTFRGVDHTGAVHFLSREAGTYFSVTTGYYEVASLYNIMLSEDSRKLTTHFSYRKLLLATGWSMAAVTIVSVEEGTGRYRTEVSIVNGDQSHQVEVRLSDAVAAAVLNRVPIYLGTELVSKLSN
jgi:bifunctional DNase/RNase